jgi:transcriptional regulator with XRE-family HTH domain
MKEVMRFRAAHTKLVSQIDANSMGKALRLARNDAGISLREIAKAIGVSASFLCDAELGNCTLSLLSHSAVPGVHQAELTDDHIHPPVSWRISRSRNCNTNTYNRGDDITPVKVTKVGRKYFEVERERAQFDIQTWRQKTDGYMESCFLYLSEQEREDEKEIGQLDCDLNRFNWRKLTLDQLRRIKAITKEPK